MITYMLSFTVSLTTRVTLYFTAYLSSAVEPSVKTKYTATLGTFAVLGGVMGPSIGALFSQIDTTIQGLTLDANNVPGFLILFCIFIMIIQVSVDCCKSLNHIILSEKRLTLNHHFYCVRLFYSLMAETVKLLK